MRRTLDQVLARTAIPYGYTLTVWSTGALATHAHGMPTPAAVFGFAAGGVVGFSLLAIIGVPAPESDDTSQATQLFAGALNVIAIGVALGLADACVRAPESVAWPLASMVATVA